MRISTSGFVTSIFNSRVDVFVFPDLSVAVTSIYASLLSFAAASISCVPSKPDAAVSSSSVGASFVNEKSSCPATVFSPSLPTVLVTDCSAEQLSSSGASMTRMSTAISALKNPCSFAPTGAIVSSFPSPPRDSFGAMLSTAMPFVQPSVTFPASSSALI